MRILRGFLSIWIATTLLVSVIRFSDARIHFHKAKDPHRNHRRSVSQSPLPSPSAEPPTPGGDTRHSGDNATSNPGIFDVRSFGAVGDASTDDTQAFRDAWKAACSQESGVLLVPSDGVFTITSTIFSGPCQPGFILQVDGVLMPPDGPDCWPSSDSKLQWLVFYKVDGMTLRGSGTIEGNGGMTLRGSGTIEGNGEKWWNLPCKPHRVHHNSVTRLSNFKFQTVDFSESLDASTLTEVNYKNFLTRLRNRLGQLPGASFMSGTAVLPIQTKPPLRWFNLTLQGQEGKETTIRFKGDNLYFIGYHMQKTDKWIELGRKGDPQYIKEKGTTFAGFGENYNDLEYVAGISLNRVSLTKHTLNKAIAVLAESTDKKKRANAVIVVIQMVSEACRFLQIGEHLATNIENANNFLYSWMVPLEKNWKTLSTMVLLAHNFPTCNVYKPQTINGEVLNTADDLRKILGVMIRSKKSEENPCKKMEKMMTNCAQNTLTRGCSRCLKCYVSFQRSCGSMVPSFGNAHYMYY